MERKTPLVSEKADFILDVLLTDYLFLAAPGTPVCRRRSSRPARSQDRGWEDTSSDRFLSRTVKSAELVRPGVSSIEALRTGQVDVWAGSASAIEQAAEGLPGAKIVPGAFTSDRTMVILPKGRSSAAQAKVVEIVNEAKKTGVVRKAIEQTGVKGVRVRRIDLASYSILPRFVPRLMHLRLRCISGLLRAHLLFSVRLN